MSTTRTRSTTSPEPSVSPADTGDSPPPWRLREKSFDYDRALSLLADDLLALGRGDVRRPAEPTPAPASVEEENAP